MLYAAEISPATSYFPQPPTNKPGGAMQKFLPPSSRSLPAQAQTTPKSVIKTRRMPFLSYQPDAWSTFDPCEKRRLAFLNSVAVCMLAVHVAPKQWALIPTNVFCLVIYTRNLIKRPRDDQQQRITGPTHRRSDQRAWIRLWPRIHQQIPALQHQASGAIDSATLPRRFIFAEEHQAALWETLWLRWLARTNTQNR